MTARSSGDGDRHGSKHPSEKQERQAEPLQPVDGVSKRPVSFYGAGRKVAREQKEQAHEEGLIYRAEIDQQGRRQRAVGGYFTIEPPSDRPVSDRRVVQHDQKRETCAKRIKAGVAYANRLDLQSCRPRLRLPTDGLAGVGLLGEIDACERRVIWTHDKLQI